MELFVAVAFALMLTTATARYAFWFECSHAVRFLAVMAAVVVVIMAVALGNCNAVVGTTLVGGAMVCLAADAADHSDGLPAKAPIATVAAMLLLAPHVSAQTTLFSVVGLATIALAALAWAKTWTSPLSSGA